MTTNRIKVIAFVLLLTVFSVNLFSRSILAADPVPDYINEVSYNNLVDVATVLVEQFGPRQEDTYSPYLDDSCTLNTGIVYPKSNVEMSTDYVRGLFEDMGYSPSSITMEEVPNGAGHNVFVTKVGSEYPNEFIEFSAHIDSVVHTPGGNDNASGSTAVVELARVLKDYPNRYSMRFILWVGEEFDTDRGTAYYGSAYHVQQLLSRGEEVKAGMVMDHIGWPYPGDPTGLLNGVSYNNVESERIADMFNQVRSDYDIEIGFDKVNQIFNSDEHSYWDQGFTAVSSGGGWLYYRPEYHDCADTVANIDFDNVLLSTQQNLAVGLRLDQEIYIPDGSPINTPSPTVTNTAVPSTPTPTSSTPDPTATNIPPGGFPSTTILDDFNRANGDLGPNWGGLTEGYGILVNQLDVGVGDRLLWQTTQFGADQEVYITLTNVDPNAAEQDLLLKSQSPTTWLNGVLEVLYNPSGSIVQIWTYAPAQGWQKWGTDIPAIFANGDQFGARALSDGSVTVYRNGVPIASRDISNWQFASNSGYIGLWYFNSSNATADDFGGGTINTGPTPTLLPPTPTNTATTTPLPPTPTNTATVTPLPPTPTNTTTATPLPPTPTNTETAIPLPPTPTNTPTATPLSPTPTATLIAEFPSTNLLDDFNQVNDEMNAEWGGLTSGYSIASNQLDVGFGDRILWQAEPFGPDQEVYLTLTNIDLSGSEHDLLLKSQSGTTWLSGVLEVWYDAAGERVQVWTYANSQGWIKHGSDLLVTFDDGDQFGAKALADGTVEVYRNGNLLGSRDVSNWPYASGQGYVGMWFVNAENAVADDFGGGTSITSPNN